MRIASGRHENKALQPAGEVPPVSDDKYGIYLRKCIARRMVGNPLLRSYRDPSWKVSIHSPDGLADRIPEARYYKSLSDITKMSSAGQSPSQASLALQKFHLA